MPADPKPAPAAKPPIHWNLWLFGALLLALGLVLMAVSLEYGSAIRRWLRSTGASSTISDFAVFPSVISGFFGILFLCRAFLADIIRRYFPPIVEKSIVIGWSLLFFVGLPAVYLIPPAWAKAKAAWSSISASELLVQAKGWLNGNGTILIVVLLAIIVVLLGLIVMHLRSRSASDKPTS